MQTNELNGRQTAGQTGRLMFNGEVTPWCMSTHVGNLTNNVYIKYINTKTFITWMGSAMKWLTLY